MFEPINIYSKSNDWLGRALTNPCYNSEYDIYPDYSPLINPFNYHLPNIPLFKWAIRRFGDNATAYQAWSYSVESWYFANTKDKEGKDIFHQNDKEYIMLQLIICKFKTYPKLIDEIIQRGGLDWLQRCCHKRLIGKINTNWEGVGEKSNFIKVLCKAYICTTENIHPDTNKQLALIT
jgi:hypothetical protein